MSGPRAALRRLPWLRRRLGRAVDWVVLTVRQAPPGLRAGRGVPAEVADRLPVVLILLLGADDAVLARTVADLLAVLGPTPPVRPVLVIDGERGAFAVVRRAGLPVDHVLSSAQWARRHPTLPWSDHLQSRLRQLTRLYGTTQLVTLGPLGTTALEPGALARLLAPRRTGRARRALDRAAVALLRVIDPPATTDA